MSSPPVWVLLGQRTGDNNQLLRLAAELELPFRAIGLRYNVLRFLGPRLLGSSLASLTKTSREELQPPWPELVLGIGNRSVPPSLAIRSGSSGKSRLVRLGNPRLDPRYFDLVITTLQYDVADAPNVVRLPIGVSTAPALEPTREESEWLAKLPRPHRLLLIGGDTFMWTLSPRSIASAARALTAKGNGSVIAVTSGRTAKAVVDSAANALQGSEHALVQGGFPRYAVLLADADEIYVTADSVAMTSDAIATGKLVGLVDPDRTAAGKFFYAAAKFGIPIPVRDVRRFWRSVRRRGLAGTVEEPVAGRLDDAPVAVAVAAIRNVLRS